MPIEKISLSPACAVTDLWHAVASQSQIWLAQRGLTARDAVLLLPFAALLPPARAAFARAGGWQPRIETPLTLAAALGPPAAPAPTQCSGDSPLDRLTAGNLLRRLPWGQAWAARDAAGFSHITDSLVDAAQALRQACFERPPAVREAYWADVRSRLGAGSGPAAFEASLLRLALEWASDGLAPSTEQCFAWQPSAWIVLRMGGPEPLSEALMQQAQAPCLHLWADAHDDAPFAAAVQQAQLSRIVCDDFEAEAQAAAGVITQALNAGRTPVALVALDRELVRRIHALLERAAVPLTDETGWLLATTRAAAKVVALLQAALPQAGRDAQLDWLKTWPPALAYGGKALDSLEAHWRGRRQVVDLPAAQALWAQAQTHLQAFGGAASRPLKTWLELLHNSLASDGSLAALQADMAGAQVMQALALSDIPAWQSAAQELRLDLAGFIAWVQDCFEQTPFLPTPDAGAVVVLTPLARCFGRPFQHVVMPGADHMHLGAGEPTPSLVGDALAAALGMDHRASRRLRQRQALAQLLRAPHLTLLRRLRDADEPLTESPDVEWLLLARAQAGLPDWPLAAWQPGLHDVSVQAVPRPLPVAPGLLPTVLSASQLEALRQCPYRFFARAMLRLEDAEELQTTLAKRDYGNWLHAVLHQFHSQRQATGDDLAQLMLAAEEQTRVLDLDPAELLPYRASFERFAPDYLAWLSAREGEGWQWQEGETEHQVEPAELAGLRLRGRIDRIDHIGKAGHSRQILDYKTGGDTSLQSRVRAPLEDTQLAFYAALLGGGEGLRAAYLALDGADAPQEFEHPQVHMTARALVQGLAEEWPRLQAGAPLPALGEGSVCQHCEMRGLCRRDDWATP